MYYCNPTAEEKYYLQLLLTVIHGPQLFEHICIVNYVVYSTYCKACVVLKLIIGNQK